MFWLSRNLEKLWNTTHLELCARTRWLPHARLHQQSPHKVPTPQTGLSLTCFLQSGTNPISCKSSEDGCWHHTTTYPKRNQMHSSRPWNLAVLCASGWSNTARCTQRHCITTSQWHKGSGGCMSTTPQLRYHSPKCCICYKACNMVLLVHTDASFLSEPGGKSRASGHLYLSNCNNKDFNNGTILTLSTIIKHDMSSASKASLTALYYQCKLDAPLWTTLKELGYFQPTPTPVTTNNITAQGLIMGTMTPKASKSMDQCFHWLKCWNTQRQFQYLWHKGILNCANYSSKHHAPKHNQNVCPIFVFDNTTVPKQWLHMSPHQSWQYICYSVLTPWSTALNSNTGWLSTCKGILSIQLSELLPYLQAK